jgi:Acetylornithine deacetylase/Succinyl-diaminopimelate desuccinylase and related deacylases
MTFFEACRAFKETGDLPCHVTVLLEGEEESGSPSLPGFLADNKSELRADIALVCDTLMWDATTPAITTMLRGLVLEEVVVHGPNRDLHSGMFGGAAINPIRVLSKIIADLHDDEGRVTLPNFYDAVVELPDEVADQWHALKFDGGKFLGDVGLSVPAGEHGRSVLEMLWSRPTCEVNGIVGGYTAKGSKTVLPPRPAPKSRSGSWPGRTRKRWPRRSGPSSRIACRTIAGRNSSRTAHRVRSRCRSRPKC